MAHERLSQPHDSADHWLAFRYLTGDLADAEAASFEERLADDFGLQTALAETVPMTVGLAQAKRPSSQSHPPLRSPQSARRRANVSRLWPVGLAVAAACLVGLGLLLQSLPVVTNHVADGIAARDSNLDASSVVAMWSALGTDTADESPTVQTHRDFDDAVSGSPIDVPNWMLLAVVEDAADSVLHEEEQL